MNEHLTFDQLPARFRILIRALAMCCLALAVYVLSVDGWSVPEFLICIGLSVACLYFLAGLLISLASVVAVEVGRWLGHLVALTRRASR